MMTVEAKKGRIAMLSASLLTLVAISCASLGLWRVGADLDWAGDFVIQDGILSHWQVWIGSAAGFGGWPAVQGLRAGARRRSRGCGAFDPQSGEAAFVEQVWPMACTCST